jgi:hypothetical protein
VHLSIGRQVDQRRFDRFHIARFLTLARDPSTQKAALKRPPDWQQVLGRLQDCHRDGAQGDNAGEIVEPGVGKVLDELAYVHAGGLSM